MTDVGIIVQELGFNTCPVSPCTQDVQSNVIPVFSCSLLYEHAPVAIAFPLRVRSCPRGSCSLPLPCLTGMSQAPTRRTDAAQPSVSTTTATRGWQQPLTLWSSSSAKPRSRRRLTTPPNHRRVETIMAQPIHGIIFHPFPRISSACTCWRSSLPALT